MKINLGSGRTYIHGWTNIDIVANPMAKHPPEILCDISKKIPLPDGCADEVMGIHIFEHIQRWEIDDAVKEWKRLLKPEGKLILEMPDIIKCCKNIIERREGKVPDQIGMWGIFGDPSHKDPLMMHCWGWTFRTIEPLLATHRFVHIKEFQTQFHMIGRDVRDFRVEAQKRHDGT